MIAEAKWKPQEKRVGTAVVHLDRGQLAHSTRFMCDVWKWSHSKARRFLERLENRHMIERKTDTGVSVVTICKYSEYQISTERTGTAPAQQPAQHRHSTGTNYNKGNKDNKGKEEDTNVSMPFDTFWKIWPKKVAKENARKAWAKLSKPDQQSAYDAVLNGWFDRWQAINPRLNPIHPATFINSKRWQDDQQEGLRTINGGQNEKPASKSAKRMEAFIAGARGTYGAS